jgi:predicted phage terminase large subunit-like protein
MHVKGLVPTVEPLFPKQDQFNWFGELGAKLRQTATNQGSLITRVSSKFGEWCEDVEEQLFQEKLQYDPATAVRWNWNYRHFQAMQEILDKVTAGELRRVYFQIPIRHGKSEHNTIRYAAYRIERDPRTKVIVLSYNEDKALEFSRAIRDLVVKRGVKLSRRTADSDWVTEAGGGVKAYGAGTGVAGVNADIIIIDDPIGKREEAESETVRNSRWLWLTNDVLGRCEPHTAVLFTMSRWHEDDLAGRLRAQFSDLWHILDLPGRAEYKRDRKGNIIEYDFLGREEGDVLWPELRDEQWHDEQRRLMLEYGYASLIQGRPRPMEGGMFKWKWWKHLPELPSDIIYFVRYWDMAGTEDQGQDPDYTVGALLGRRMDGTTVICNVVRGQWSVAERDAVILQTARHDAARYYGRCWWWFETQTGIGGKESTNSLQAWVQAYGLPCSQEPAITKKETRATPLASAAESGNVYVLEDEHLPEDQQWVTTFKSEMNVVFGGKHDDQADAASGAFNKLSDPNLGFYGEFEHNV